MKFYIYTLGCKVNSYESNVMKEDMVKNGFVLSSFELADIVIINTCSVTNTADNKSLKMVKKASRENKIVIVTGCSSQNKKDEYLNIKGVAVVIGNVGKSNISSYINEYLKSKNNLCYIKDMQDVPFEVMRLNNFDKTRAFVKIQDGCNNYCSYCIIPYLRGNVRSKKVEDVLSEINTLVDNGHKEVVLTGIHTGHYGSDLGVSFSNLISEIIKINGLERLRISSVEITELDDEFLKLLENSKILVDHIHIPIQSGCDKVLKDMNRKYDKAYFIDKIEAIRNVRCDISITTDLIVGFPGESVDDFNETIDTIKQVDFSKIHVFPYSARAGTPAADMECQVDDVVKNERVKIIMDISRKQEIKYFNKFVGKVISFIPEVYKDGYLIGHTGNYLQIKCVGSKDLLNKDVVVRIDSIDYPYCISTIIA